jgi:hypothetical protein
MERLERGLVCVLKLYRGFLLTKKGGKKFGDPLAPVVGVFKLSQFLGVGGDD